MQDFVYNTKKFFKSPHFRNLSPRLKNKLTLETHGELIKMFWFAFNDLDSEMNFPPLLMHRLVTKLQTALFQPGENVIQLGESVEYLYLIVKGQIAIIDNTGCFVLSELGPQSYFGEYQILREVKSNFTFMTLNQD